MTNLGKRLAALFLAAAMVVTFIPVLGTQSANAADRIVIDSVSMTTDLSEVFVYNEPVGIVSFTIEEGSPVTDGDWNWQKKEDGEWVTHGWYDSFTPGIWRLEKQIRIDSSEFVLGWPFTAIVDGVEWTTLGEPMVDDDFSYNWIISPEMVIEEPDELTVRDSSDYDIGVNYVGEAIENKSVADCAEGGVKPYSYSKLSGPDWIIVDPSGGINGTPLEVGSNDDLVIRVTDKTGAHADLTISVGITTIYPEDRTNINTLELTTDTNITPVFNDDVAHKGFESEEGNPASVANAGWEKKIDGIWENVYSGKFSVGAWRLKVQIYIGDENGTLYKLADPFTATVNGISWITDPDGVQVFDTSSYVWAYSPEVIVTGDLKDAVIEVSEDNPYTGSAIMQPSKVSHDGLVLVEGTDYTVSYTDSNGNAVETPINAGTYNVIITGKGYYTGTVTKTFRITARKITPAVTLSATSCTWNGSTMKTAVTVKDGSTKLAVSDYYVRFKNNKNVGKASAVVTLKDNYSGSKTVTFKINPKGTNLTKVTKAKKAASVKWNKQSAKMSASRITGYQIQLATDSKFTKNKKLVTVKGYSKVSKKVTGLKGGKKYYVRIRTYKTVSGTKYYSPWSKVKTVTTKK